MKNEFVTYDLALRMKELGYNEPCFGFYDDIDDDNTLSFIRIEGLGENLKRSITLAPTWQSAFAWFREKYGVYMVPRRYDETKWWVERDGFFCVYEFFEEAQQACLEKLCEIVEKLN